MWISAYFPPYRIWKLYFYPFVERGVCNYRRDVLIIQLHIVRYSSFRKFRYRLALLQLLAHIWPTLSCIIDRVDRESFPSIDSCKYVWMFWSRSRVKTVFITEHQINGEFNERLLNIFLYLWGSAKYLSRKDNNLFTMLYFTLKETEGAIYFIGLIVMPVIVIWINIKEIIYWFIL